MQKEVREYIKQKIKENNYVTITDGDAVFAAIGVCHGEHNDDEYSLTIVRNNFYGTDYDYDSLSKCFHTLSRWESEGKCCTWRIPENEEDI